MQAEKSKSNGLQRELDALKTQFEKEIVGELDKLYKENTSLSKQL